MPRSKSFKKWYEESLKAGETEVSQRILSKQATKGRWKQKLDEMGKSRASVIEGYVREDYISHVNFEVRKLTNDIASENKILEQFKQKVADADAIKERIQSHPQIESVSISMANGVDTLKVKTKMLKTGRSKMGQYEIFINIQTKNLRIRNKTHYNPSYSHLDHWAVNDGKPCMGEWADGFMKYMKNAEIFLLIDSAIQFLCTAGWNSAYVQKATWLAGLVEKKTRQRSSTESDEDSDSDDDSDEDEDEDEGLF